MGYTTSIFGARSHHHLGGRGRILLEAEADRFIHPVFPQQVHRPCISSRLLGFVFANIYGRGESTLFALTIICSCSNVQRFVHSRPIRPVNDEINMTCSCNNTQRTLMGLEVLQYLTWAGQSCPSVCQCYDIWLNSCFILILPAFSALRTYAVSRNRFLLVLVLLLSLVPIGVNIVSFRHVLSG